MNCLCCGKSLSTEDNGWHKRCVKKFFGTDSLPLLDLSEEALQSYATETVFKGLTVPGVQRKMSLHLSNIETPRLTLVDYPTGYILKPQTPEYRNLPEAEDLAMRIAECAGVKTVPHALLQMNGQYAYITKRIDRAIKGKRRVIVEKYAMEDFCQLDGRLTADKYRGSYERCAKIIGQYSTRKGLDLSELFLRLAVSFVSGNSDMHLKNFSLIETAPGSAAYVLSAAYDLLPVNVLLPEDHEELALTLNGKKTNLRRSDFLHFAEQCGMTRPAAEKILQSVTAAEADYLRLCNESYLPEDLKAALKELIAARCARLRA
ncbi:MAG: HipA domain-containing protein [Clostridia bacterium]|nr:HipA domain-containing protein [Clostridia bacterium]